MRRRIAALVLAAALPLAACETTQLFEGNPDSQTPGSSDWQSTDPLPAPSVEVLWDHVRAVADGEGYVQDDRRTHFEHREFVTRWVTLPGTVRFEGQRRRAHVLLEPADGGKWFVRACVLRQRNADIDEPTNPARADWESDGVDVSRTKLLLWKIQAGFEREPAGESEEPGETGE